MIILGLGNYPDIFLFDLVFLVLFIYLFCYFVFCPADHIIHFYLVVKEAPVKEVCEAFKVARGMVQALQENAGRFASMVSLFCERLGWHDLEGLVSKFQNRVSFGVRAEIVELTTIPYVKVSPQFIDFIPVNSIMSCH